MKNLWRFLQSLGLLSLTGAFIMTAISAFAVIAASFGFHQPSNYFQYMRVPYWAVLLPAAGILALFPLALRLAFMRETLEEKVRPTKPVNLRDAVRGLRGKFSLKPM